MTDVDFALRCELNTIFIRSCPDLTVGSGGSGVVPWQAYLDRLVAIIQEYKRLKRPILLQKMFPSPLGDMEYEEGMLEMVQEVCYRQRIEDVQVVIRSIVQVGCENKARVQAHKIAIPELSMTQPLRDEDDLDDLDDVVEDSASSSGRRSSGKSKHEKKPKKSSRKASEQGGAIKDNLFGSANIQDVKQGESSMDSLSPADALAAQSVTQSASTIQSPVKPIQSVTMQPIPMKPMKPVQPVQAMQSLQGMPMQQQKPAAGSGKPDKKTKINSSSNDDPFIMLS